jgi:hypothetical protein
VRGFCLRILSVINDLKYSLLHSFNHVRQQVPEKEWCTDKSSSGCQTSFLHKILLPFAEFTHFYQKIKAEE